MDKKKRFIVTVMAVLMCFSASFSALAAVTNPNANSTNISQWKQFPVQKASSYSSGYTKAVQRLLMQYSTSTRTKIVNAGGVDGSFGKGTTNALKDFQASQDLSSDGSCGPATWGGLCALLDIPNHPNGYFYYRTFAGCSYTYYAIRQGDSTGNWAVQTGTDVATTTSAGSYTTFKTY